MNKPLFFDSWSEGPFTYEYVKGMVDKDPGIAHKFHTSENVSFAEYDKVSRPIDINIHPLVKQAYLLSLEIEGLPASEEQTELSTESSNLLISVFNYVLRNVEAVKGVDLLDRICEECLVGRMGETSINDDKDGTLHCSYCERQSKRYVNNGN